MHEDYLYTKTHDCMQLGIRLCKQRGEVKLHILNKLIQG